MHFSILPRFVMKKMRNSKRVWSNISICIVKSKKGRKTHERVIKKEGRKRGSLDLLELSTYLLILKDLFKIAIILLEVCG